MGNFSSLQDIYEDIAGTVYSFEERNACMTLTRDDFPPSLICLTVDPLCARCATVGNF